MPDKKAFIKLVAEAEKIFRNEKELTDLDLDGAGGKTVSFLEIFLIFLYNQNLNIFSN